MHIRANVASLLLIALFSTGLFLQQAGAEPFVADRAEDVRPVAAGERAPAFELRTVDDEPYRFDPGNLERPVLLILFRGGWCPYCNLHLSELRHVIPDIRALGVDIVFLSGDRPEVLYEGLSDDTQADIAGLDYRIYSDAAAHAAEALGVAFRVDVSYIDKLEEHGVDTSGSSIDRKGILPVPAVFAVGTDGIVTFSEAIPDYRERVAPETVLDVAERLVAR